LTPKKYQSGQTDVTGRISKIGDGGVRTALYEAANVILTRPVKGSTLKSWGMRLAARAGIARPRSRSPASLPWCCTACWPTEQVSSPTKLQWPQPANVRRLQVRAVPNTGRPEQGPVAGTMDQVRPMTFQQGFATARR
jgi:hypothetical protein